MVGAAPSGSGPRGAGRASCAVGRGPARSICCLPRSPSCRSRAPGPSILAPATWNSVTSVPSFCHGPSAPKVRDDVLERVPHEPPEEPLRTGGGAPAAYPAPDAHLAHHLGARSCRPRPRPVSARAGTWLFAGARSRWRCARIFSRASRSSGRVGSPRVRQRVVVGRPPGAPSTQQAQ